MRLHPCTLENVRKKNDLIVFSLFDIALRQQTDSAVANKIIHQQRLLAAFVENRKDLSTNGSDMPPLCTGH